MTYHGIMKSTQVHVQFDGRTIGTRDGDGNADGHGDGSGYEYGHTSRVSSDTEGEKKIGVMGL